MMQDNGREAECLWWYEEMPGDEHELNLVVCEGQKKGLFRAQKI